MSKHNSTIETNINSICQVLFTRTFFRKMFCKLLSKHLWWTLFLVKFHSFSILFRTPLDRYIWSMELIFWDAYFFRHSNNIQTRKALLQKLLLQRNLNKSFKSYLGNKKQKARFAVVFRFHVHFVPLMDMEVKSKKSAPRKRPAMALHETTHCTPFHILQHHSHGEGKQMTCVLYNTQFWVKIFVDSD